MISLPGSSNSGGGRENNELCESGCGPSEAYLKPSNNVEGTTGPESLGLNVSDSGNEEGAAEDDNLVLSKDGHIGTEDDQTEVDMDVVDSPVVQVNIEVASNVIVAGSVNSLSLPVNADNGYIDTQNQSLHKMGGSCILFKWTS